MEEAQESSIHTYEFNQRDKDYILIIGLINNNLIIECRGHIDLAFPIYIKDFPLGDLIFKLNI